MEGYAKQDRQSDVQYLDFSLLRHAIDGVEEGNEAQCEVCHEENGCKRKGIIDALCLILCSCWQRITATNLLIFLHLDEELVYTARIACLYITIQQREYIPDIERMLVLHGLWQLIYR